MGDEQTVGYEELLAPSRRPSRRRRTSLSRWRRSSRCSTRRRSSSSTASRRSSRRRAAPALEPHLVGELIASEAEVRTGRCDDVRRRAPSTMGERRAQLRALVDAARHRARRRSGRIRGAVAGPAHHRHAALPAERRVAALRRLAQQHLRPARARRDQRPGSRDPRHERAAQLPPRAARGLGELALRRGRVHAISTPRARRSSRGCSRAAASPTGSTAGTTGRATSASSTRPARSTEHTQMWWSVRPHLVFPTVEIRICDAQPDSRRVARRSPRSSTR